MADLRLDPGALRRRCDPDAFSFATTADVAPLEGTIGQERALEALAFGLEIKDGGYNIFATGPIGTGKRSTVQAELERHAAARAAPSDWVYLFNFGDDERPLAVALPTGEGRGLASEMSRFVLEACREIPRAFESERYQQRRREAGEQLEARRDEALAELRAFALQRGLALELTPAGLVTIPLIEGKPVTPQAFGKLPAAQQQQFRDAGHEVEKRTTSVMTRLREIERDAQERLRKVDREVALFAVGHLVDDVKLRYGEHRAVARWLDQVREDVIENLEQFREQAGDGQAQLPAPLLASVQRAREEFLGRYEVNVLVARSEAGAPVVVEQNPTYYNLFGRVDYQTVLGGAVTSHRLIRPGAVHRANGGYLLLDAIAVLSRPFVWDKLKEVLRTRHIQIENIGEQYMLFPTTTQRPQPIELDLKVVLVGPAAVHQLVYALDEDVRKLFKVKADFDVEMPWSDPAPQRYAEFVSRMVRDQGLRHFDRGAIATIVECGARDAAHQGKLTTRFSDIADIVSEASHWAGRAGREVATADDVERAIEAKRRRSNRVEEKERELIAEGTLLVDIEGERVGQVNGLSVASLGDYEFGLPARITASVSLGEGEVVSIDRETELSGAIHDKGFLILSGFLRERYGGTRPLSLQASLVFEQSYGGIEGDSASCAELYALMSSLADVPIRQGVAVTGSVDQHGEVQPIGGVNEKIEGFFAVCSQRGLNGRQGVVIPATNVRHLMLRDDVVEAVRDGRFSVWSVRTVDEGIELLTGVPAGERGPDGAFAEGTIHRRIEDRLAELAEAARAAAKAKE